MAVTWQRYAAGVLIAAGVAVTGTRIWERGDRNLRGEDVAHLNAEIAKRLMWYRLQGTNEPGTDINLSVKIGFGLEWLDIYGEPQSSPDGIPYSDYTEFKRPDVYPWQGMAGARALAVSETAASHIDYRQLEHHIWLDAGKDRPGDGSTICDDAPYVRLVSVSTNSSWAGDYEVEEWAIDATNHADKIACVTTRSGTLTAWPGLAASNAPLWRTWGMMIDDNPVSAVPYNGDWWKDIGNGATNYKYACEAWPTSSTNWPPLVTGRGATIKNYSQAMNVVTNLRRSIAFIEVSSVSYTNIINYTGHQHKETTNFTAEAGLYNDLSTLCNHARGYAVATNVILSGVGCASMWCDAETHAYAYFGGGMEENGYAETVIDAVVHWSATQGITMPWPCNAAYASGMVSRVEIFGVFDYSFLDFVGDVPHYTDYIRSLASPGWDFEVKGDSQAKCRDAASAEWTWIKFPIAHTDFAETSETAKIVNLYKGFGHYNPVRLTKLISAETPSAPPMFDLTMTPVGVGLASSVRDIFAASEEYYHDDEYPEDSFTFLSVERKLDYDAEVLLLGFVIVVDWDF
ncbi:MAG: hypothetical protein WC319_11165 [Candidatus Paceibacterota bacterium]|jgi:hypothetical protein